MLLNKGHVLNVRFKPQKGTKNETGKRDELHY